VEEEEEGEREEESNLYGYTMSRQSDDAGPHRRR